MVNTKNRIMQLQIRSLGMQNIKDIILKRSAWRTPSSPLPMVVCTYILRRLTDVAILFELSSARHILWGYWIEILSVTYWRICWNSTQQEQYPPILACCEMGYSFHTMWIMAVEAIFMMTCDLLQSIAMVNWRCKRGVKKKRESINNQHTFLNITCYNNTM